jgi:hypothetical protein
MVAAAAPTGLTFKSIPGNEEERRFRVRRRRSSVSSALGASRPAAAARSPSCHLAAELPCLTLRRSAESGLVAAA